MAVRMSASFSYSRLRAILVKEFIQMRRDRLTFAMMVGIPIIQLMLFGYAINTDPKHLPTRVQIHDSGPFSRSFISAMTHSGYFAFQGVSASDAESERLLRSGEVLFVVVVPANFERDVVRGERPAILLDADATDPAAASGAIAALNSLVSTSLRDMTEGPLAALQGKPEAFSVLVHKRYNPAGVTRFNIVPGLLAIIMSMTMVMITSIAIVREAERGTIETLLSTPVRPVEVMVGKILPYVLVGYVQTALFLAVAHGLFTVPFQGSWLAFLVGLNVFILVNLMLGFFFSTIARNQMQAMQMSFFYIMPSILLSGFMFPFFGMPVWAQVIGAAIPSTHFIRIMRKIMLKSGALPDIIPDLTALGVIMTVIAIAAILRYRQTLD